MNKFEIYLNEITTTKHFGMIGPSEIIEYADLLAFVVGNMIINERPLQRALVMLPGNYDYSKYNVQLRKMVNVLEENGIIAKIKELEPEWTSQLPMSYILTILPKHFIVLFLNR